MKRKLTAAILAVLMAVTLGGCGGQQAETPDTQAETTGTGETQAPADEVQNEGEAKYGVEVKVSSIEGPVTLYLPQSSTTGDRWFASPAAESLGRLAEDGTTQPWLAEEFVTDPENLTFTIKLRDGVKFHDGSLCNAEAVAWNIEQYIANGKGAEIGNPASVTADDDLTVTVHFDQWIQAPRASTAVSSAESDTTHSMGERFSSITLISMRAPLGWRCARGRHSWYFDEMHPSIGPRTA